MSIFNLLALEVSFERFLESLPYVGFGMLGIFIVIGVIILVMTAMIAIENKIKENKAKSKAQENGAQEK